MSWNWVIFMFYSTSTFCRLTEPISPDRLALCRNTVAFNVGESQWCFVLNSTVVLIFCALYVDVNYHYWVILQ